MCGPAGCEGGGAPLKRGRHRGRLGFTVLLAGREAVLLMETGACGFEDVEAVCRTAFGRSIASSGARETGWGCGQGNAGACERLQGVFVGQGDGGRGVEN